MALQSEFSKFFYSKNLSCELVHELILKRGPKFRVGCTAPPSYKDLFLQIHIVQYLYFLFPLVFSFRKWPFGLKTALWFLLSSLVPFRSYRRLLFIFWTKTSHFVFLNSHFFGGLGATCTVHRLIAKFVVDLLFVFIELFSLGVRRGWGATSEYWLEIGVFERCGSVSAKFWRSRGRPREAFLHG